MAGSPPRFLNGRSRKRSTYVRFEKKKKNVFNLPIRTYVLSEVLWREALEVQNPFLEIGESLVNVLWHRSPYKRTQTRELKSSTFCSRYCFALSGYETWQVVHAPHPRVLSQDRRGGVEPPIRRSKNLKKIIKSCSRGAKKSRKFLHIKKVVLTSHLSKVKYANCLIKEIFLQAF